MTPIVKEETASVAQATSACLNMCTGQSFDDDDQDMFLPGCRGGLRNRQLLMNTSETADEREASCAASGRLLGRLLSRECVRSYLGLHPSSWLTFPEGVSMERDLVECTHASSARCANRRINDHYGPHRSPWYRPQFISGNRGRRRGKRSYGAHSEELESGSASIESEPRT